MRVRHDEVRIRRTETYRDDPVVRDDARRVWGEFLTEAQTQKVRGGR